MYKHNRPLNKKRDKRPAFIMVALLVLGAALLIASAKSILSFPVVQGVGTYETEPNNLKQVKLAWPKYGQSAIGAKGYGVLEVSEDKKPQPTASVAKVMTALAILEKHPLEVGEKGPEIEITKQDEELFGEYWAKNGTSVRVAAGDKISLYKALQYILIPSANNIADTTAIWAFGSMEEYTNYANNLAKEIGMENSNFADASGFSPKTVSTASDLVKLGEKAMQNPVIAEIVRTWEVKLPDGNKAQNSNVYLEYNGNRVIGVKTGDTDQAGGVYMFAGEHDVDGETITIIGVVMGAKNLSKAEKDAMKLLKSSKKGFSKEKVLSSGENVGSYQVPWQGSIDVTSSQDIHAVTWSNKPIDITVKLSGVDQGLSSGDEVGQIVINHGSSTTTYPANLSGSLQSPSTIWRVKRYF